MSGDLRFPKEPPGLISGKNQRHFRAHRFFPELPVRYIGISWISGRHFPGGARTCNATALLNPYSTGGLPKQATVACGGPHLYVAALRVAIEIDLLFKDRKSVILGVWAVPGAPETLPKGGGRSPHQAEWSPGPPGPPRPPK